LFISNNINHIKAAICHGEDYTENGFRIIQPMAGVRRDTVKLGNAAGCDEYNILELTVNVSLAMPNVILGDTSPCTEKLVTYAFAGSETLTKFEWEVPGNAVVIAGRYSSQITLYYEDDTSGEVIMKGENGCGTGAIPLQVRPRQTYDLHYSDNVCVGSNYNNYGFNLGVQDNIGFFIHTKRLTTVAGCDSSVVLALNVLPIPAVRIEPKELMLCNPGEQISLFAVTEDDVEIDWEEDDEGYMVAFLYNCGLSYLWNTGDFTKNITENPAQTTTYTVTVATESGCSATANRLVIVNTNEPVVIDAEICEGETYSAYGIVASETDVYNKTIVKDGCTIPFTVNLTVNPAQKTTIKDVVCAGVRYQKHGLDFTLYQEGLFRDSLRFFSSSGCDSIVYLEFLVKPAPVTILYDTICQNSRYSRYGFDTVPAISGRINITRQLQSENGCDSTVVLNLLVNPVTVNTISDNANSGEVYKKFNFNFQTGTSDVTVIQNLKSYTGCDSTVVLNLKVCTVKDTVVYDTRDNSEYHHPI